MRAGEIVWFEIPVEDIDRAILFYNKVIGFTIVKERLTTTDMGVIKKEEAGMGGVLVKKDNLKPGGGHILFFSVIDMAESLDRTNKYGGKIIRKKTILKQIMDDGSVIIPKTLIDGNIGYYAEVEDSEGNRLALYSNS